MATAIAPGARGAIAELRGSSARTVRKTKTTYPSRTNLARVGSAKWCRKCAGTLQLPKESPHKFVRHDDTAIQVKALHNFGELMARFQPVPNGGQLQF